MTGGRLRKIEILFERALDLPEGQRAAFLDRECADDLDLRREVESLLAADNDAGEFMDRPAAGPRPAPSPGIARERVGRYRILRKLGAGGMSEVFLGVRDDDEFRKHVAIKVVRQDLDREDLLRRFRTERQILAGLDHPNIAKLLDGGTTTDGLPYFVMDYIDGLPIDEYCDRNRLTIRERLELFRTICSSVHYAHQNLVVHRDIKASNILVTADGSAKLLDFGIAKLLRPDHFAAQAEYTVTWLRPMTPRYASPEQIQGGQVGTPSDVYSLGVLLYKLLTGHLPYLLESRPPAEMPQAILEQEAERPSTVVTRVEDVPGGKDTGPTPITPEGVSRSRNLPPQQLARRLSGDLDNIVLMALRKEPQRRYASVEQFSEDIRRHFEGLPVVARKDTFGYRAQKFLRRNRLAVAAAAAFVLVLIGFSIGMGVLARRAAEERNEARLERDRAEQVLAFLEDILEASDPERAKGEDISAREILDRGAERIDREFSDQPEIQAKLFRTTGNVYKSLGLYDRARPLLEQALELSREALGEDDPVFAQCLHDVGDLLRLSGEYAEAETMLRRAADLRRRLFGENSKPVAISLAQLGATLRYLGQLDEGEHVLGEAVQILEGLEDEAALAETKNNLAALFLDRTRYREAEQLFREALQIRRRTLGPDHYFTAEAINNLGVCLGIQGRYDEAEPLLREALETRRRLLGEDHPWVAHGYNNLGKLMQRKGDFAAAEPLLREGLRLRLESAGGDNAEVVRLKRNLAEFLRDKGDYAEAEVLARESADGFGRLFGPRHPDRAVGLVIQGSTMVGRGRAARAEPLLREGLEIVEASMDPEHWRIPEARSLLGECLAAQKRFAEAEPYLLAGHEGLIATRGPDQIVRTARRRLHDLYVAWGRPDRAAEYPDVEPE